VPASGPTKHKHIQLYEELGKAIQKGAYMPGQRLPTEAELMQQFGVSRTTVTRTLRDLEHQGVIRRRRGSGTFVKEIQRTAAGQFGMIVHGIEPGSIFLNVYEALARATDRSGGHLRLTHLNAQEKRDVEAVEVAERMIEMGVRGVFYLPHSISPRTEPVNQRVTETFAKANVAIVLLDRDVCNFPERSNYDLVGVDNLRGGYLLGQHLADAGCKHPLFFSENIAFSSARARWIGYRAAMEANGLEARSFGVDVDDAAAVLQLVKKHKPDGIACDNDTHAAIIMRHLLNAKISIPAEIKLAGFDDTPTASLLTVPLTTVRQHPNAIAMRAMSVMNDRIAHPHLPPVHVAVHCELIVRESTVSKPAAVIREALESSSIS
jgi:DNA-binding LacI/PurR family transcriptional regulator